MHRRTFDVQKNRSVLATGPDERPFMMFTEVALRVTAEVLESRGYAIPSNGALSTGLSDTWPVVNSKSNSTA